MFLALMSDLSVKGANVLVEVFSQASRELEILNCRGAVHTGLRRNMHPLSHYQPLYSSNFDDNKIIVKWSGPYLTA